MVAAADLYPGGARSPSGNHGGNHGVRSLGQAREQGGHGAQDSWRRVFRKGRRANRYIPGRAIDPRGAARRVDLVDSRTETAYAAEVVAKLGWGRI